MERQLSHAIQRGYAFLNMPMETPSTLDRINDPLHHVQECVRVKS